MKLHSLRKSLLAGVLALVAATLLTSCGGGGSASSGAGGLLAILPATGTIYAGVPVTFTVQGGRPPYTLSSSEPLLLPVPQTLTGFTFTTIAANPGVIDVGLNPDAVPSRTAIITVRDSGSGQPQVSGSYNVAQNFLTGYGIAFSPISCTPPLTAPTAVTGTSLPSGCELALQFSATVQGNLFGDRPYRLEVIRGPLVFVNATTNVTSNSITVRSDHSGTILAVIRTLSSVPTQLAIIRITDVATGVYTDNAFTVVGGASGNTLTAVPNTFSFTGADTATCGTGEADFFVFDGTPPYNAQSSNPNVVVFAIDANSQPGVFRIRAINSGVCLSNATVVVTDRFGARTTVTVTTDTGSSPPPAPPTPPVSTSPQTITLGCGQSGSVSVTGGTPPYGASSSTPGVSATVTGNTLTITRAGPAGPGSAAQTTSTVNVTDGATVASVTVTAPTTCP